VFAASVAFLKDVAPRPQPWTMSYLWTSWMCFTAGLFAVVLSFLFSYQTCMARIDNGAAKLTNPEAKEPKDWWGIITHCCNYACVAFLFVGMIAWVVFAIENITKAGGK
jgi:hypothetical protein